MELSWSTFLLEGINFLVLLWILQRLFYRPVLAILARRRAEVEQTLNEAKEMHETAEALRRQYQGRLSEWEQERAKARGALREELEAERERRLQALSEELAQEEEKNQVAEQRRIESQRRETEQSALQQGARFAARLLSQLAGPELEARLLELVTGELQNLSEERRETLARSAAGSGPAAVVVDSAYPIEEERRVALEHALRKAVGVETVFEYRQDEALVAGIRISLGPWVLHANVQDELKAFAGFDYDIA